MLNSEEKDMIIGMFPFLSENPVVFDVGSNKGGFSDIFIEEYKNGCDLHLFEPNKKLLSFTQIKYEYNTNISYNELAAYKENGEVDFFYFENFNNELSSIYKESEGWSDLPMLETRVKTIKLDDYCRIDHINFIDYLKIDCEGADVDVLLGCKELIGNGNIRIIQIEYGSHYKRANHTFKEVIDLFEGTEYKIYYYDRNNYHEVIDFDEDYHACNYIITKEKIKNQSIGWNKDFILNVCDLPKFDMCLEIGAFEGLTTKYICSKMLNEGGRVVVVDPLLDYYVENDKRSHPEFQGQYQRFLRNTKGYPVELKRGKSETELPKLFELRFGFIFVDGNHYEPWPYFDACWAFAICKEGGYILIDDYDKWSDETKQSVDKFLEEFKDSFEIISKGYQVLIRKTIAQYNELTQSYY